MYGCEIWTIKKAEHRRTDAFELWCWRRLLRAPWTARRSNQSILKEVNPKYSLEGLMLKLKLQYFGHLMQTTDSLEKTLMLGKSERDDRGWDGWMASRTWRTWVWTNSGSWWWTGKPGVLQSMGPQRVGHNWVTELNWTVGVVAPQDKGPSQTRDGTHVSLAGRFFTTEPLGEAPDGRLRVALFSMIATSYMWLLRT